MHVRKSCRASVCRRHVTWCLTSYPLEGEVRNPRLLALMTVGLWSFGATLARLISLRSQFLLLSLSFSFTLATLALYFVRAGTRVSLRELFGDLKYIFVGPCGYFVYAIGTNRSFRAFDTASETTVLNYTWPLFLVVFSRILVPDPGRTRLAKLLESLGVMLGFVSAVLVATGGDVLALRFTSPAGVGWGLLAGMSYGLFSAFSRTVPEGKQPVFLLSSIISSWILMLGLSVSEVALLKTLRPADLLVVALQGCLLNGLGYIAWTRANRLAQEQGVSSATLASMTLSLPLLGIFWVSAILREATILRPYFAASLLLILASSALCQNAGNIASLLVGKRPATSD